MCRMCRRNVGRGPVPRYAAIAGDRPPRYIQTCQDQALFTYGGRRRGLKPRLPLRLSVGCDRLIATSGSGDPELQRGMFAGDRPPRYECGAFFHRRAKNW